MVKEYVRGKKMDLEEKATVRFETMPGKQGQMDWGFFEDHQVYEDGKWKKLYCFLMVLGYSRMRYIEFVSTPVRFCNFSPDRKCHKTAGKGVQPLNTYTCRFRPSSLTCTDKSGLDGLQADK